MKQVLVVDDDHGVRTVMSLLLERFGLSVRTADDGLSALKEIETSPPGLIILDLAMPHLGGMSVLEHLHGNPHACDIPVLIVTAHPVSSRSLSTRFANVLGVLEKGVLRSEDLYGYVSTIFDLEE